MPGYTDLDPDVSYADDDLEALAREYRLENAQWYSFIFKRVCDEVKSMHAHHTELIREVSWYVIDETDLPPMPVELVSIDSTHVITCLTESGYLIKYYYEPYYHHATRDEPVDAGIEFDWCELGKAFAF